MLLNVVLDSKLLNENDLNNACIPVVTPMAISKYTSDQLRQQHDPFALNNKENEYNKASINKASPS